MLRNDLFWWQLIVHILFRWIRSVTQTLLVEEEALAHQVLADKVTRLLKVQTDELGSSRTIQSAMCRDLLEIRVR